MSINSARFKAIESVTMATRTYSLGRILEGGSPASNFLIPFDARVGPTKMPTTIEETSSRIVR